MGTELLGRQFRGSVFGAAVDGCSEEYLERPLLLLLMMMMVLGYPDEPVPDLLPVERLLTGGGLVGEHRQAGGQVGAHLVHINKLFSIL